MEERRDRYDKDRTDNIDDDQDHRPVRAVNKAAEQRGEEKNGQVTEEGELKEFAARTGSLSANHAHDGELMEPVAENRYDLGDREREETDFENG
jgi:hypothetical protein